MRGAAATLLLTLVLCLPAFRARAELVLEDPDEPKVPQIDPAAKLPDGALARLPPPQAAPKAVAFSPDGKMVAVAGADKTVRLFAADSTKPVAVLEGHEGSVLDVAFSPDGRHVASAGEDSTVRLWDLKTFKPVRRFEGHDSMVKGVCFSPDGAWLATAGADQLVKVWDVETGKERHSMSGHDANVDRITWSRDGRTLLSEAADSTARIWDATLGQEVRMLPYRDGEVAAVAISPDGRLGITTRGDMSWHVFEIVSGQDLLVLRGQAANGSCAAFAPDSRSVFTGALDGSVRQWDLASGQMLRRVIASGPRIASLAVSADGMRLITASVDCNVLLWDLTQPPPNPSKADDPPSGSVDAYLDKAWDLLGSPEYETRTAALWRFLHQGEAGAKALARHLPVARTTDAKDIQRLIERLDDASYGVREATMQELRDLGGAAIPLLEEAQEHASPEIRSRAYDLLHEGSASAAVREILAVEILGWMKAPPAKEHLAKLAKGPRDLAVTQQALAVLERK